MIIQHYIVHKRKNTFSGERSFVAELYQYGFKACETHNLEHQRDSLPKYLLKFVIESETDIFLTIIRSYISRNPTFH